MFSHRQMVAIFGSLVARKEHLGMFRLRQMGAIFGEHRSLCAVHRVRVRCLSGCYSTKIIYGFQLIEP